MRDVHYAQRTLLFLLIVLAILIYTFGHPSEPTPIPIKGGPFVVLW